MRKGLAITSPVMEVEVLSFTSARSVLQILTGMLQAQLLVHVTPQAKISQYFKYVQTLNKQQKQLPHNNRLKQLLLKATSYLSKGDYDILPHNKN